MNYLDEDSEVMVGSSSINQHMSGSTATGMNCPQAQGIVMDVDQSALWDLSLMSHVQVNCMHRF